VTGVYRRTVVHVLGLVLVAIGWLLNQGLCSADTERRLAPAARPRIENASATRDFEPQHEALGSLALIQNNDSFFT